ncbi:MAG TPA: hypothetical protein VMV40_07175 [Acidiferrobacter sp.]|nr:hypothetical protein [Acidiferrobacter sp.]
MESMRIHKEKARVAHIDHSNMGAESPGSLGPLEFFPGFNIAGRPRLKPYYGAGVGDFPPQGEALEEIIAFLQDAP